MKKFALLSVLMVVSFVLAGCGDVVFDGIVATEHVDNNEENINLNDKTMKTEVQKGDTVAVLKTNMGELKMLLYTEQAPKTTENFIELSKAGKYENVPFHRIIGDFMIQGGDFENMNGTGGYTFEGPGTSLVDEFGEGLEHIYGAVSMANAGPNSGGSQFFIVQSADGTAWLNGAHAVFGYIYEGHDIIEKIAAVETGMNDVPVDAVVIEKVVIETI